MKQFRVLLPLLLLALVLSGCQTPSRNTYAYTFTNQDGTVTLTVDPEAGTITDGQDVYHFAFSASGQSGDCEITYPNGATYYWQTTNYVSHGGWSDDYDDTRYIPGNILIDALTTNQPRERSGNPLLGLLLIGLGLFNCVAPEVSFHFSKGWMFRNAEPSEAYLEITRIGGGIAVFIGVLQLFI